MYFTPKMFRKTISTHLEEKGCPDKVIKAIGNRVLAQGVEKSYQHGDLFHMKKDWIEKWQVMLEDVRKDKTALVNDKDSQLSIELSSKVSDIFD